MSDWSKVAATMCGHTTYLHSSWNNVIPGLCIECKKRYPARVLTCDECGVLFHMSSVRRFIWAKKGLGLPTRCPRCYGDIKLFDRALRQVMEQCTYPVTVSFKRVSLLGFRTGDKVAVIRGKRDNDLVAEIGIVGKDHVRVALIRYANDDS